MDDERAQHVLFTADAEHSITSHVRLTAALQKPIEDGVGKGEHKDTGIIAELLCVHTDRVYVTSASPAFRKR